MCHFFHISYGPDLSCNICNPISQEQGLCGSSDISPAHWTLPKLARSLALLAHNVSTWCEGHDGPIFEANWTGAAGALLSFFRFFGLWRFHCPLGSDVKAVFGVGWLHLPGLKAHFIQFSLHIQNYNLIIKTLWFLKPNLTGETPLSSNGSTFLHEPRNGLCDKLLVGDLRGPSQLCEGHWTNDRKGKARRFWMLATA